MTIHLAITDGHTHPRRASTPTGSTRRRLVAFGPFDDDFDPFEDEEETDVLLPLERGSCR